MLEKEKPISQEKPPEQKLMPTEKVVPEEKAEEGIEIGKEKEEAPAETEESQKGKWYEWLKFWKHLKEE